MSILKTTLLKIKEVSEKDFKYCYDFIVEQYVKEYDLEEQTDLASYNIDHLEEVLHITISQIKGMEIVYKDVKQKIYPLATYGWDGGNSISTTEFNLKSLKSNNFGGGPISDIVTLKTTDYPGIAFYYHPDLSEIQIFI